ncbi:Na+/Pi symporter [Serendipita sp. 405]|nr:Na+/Pi symporter [Serendipita sp. 405]
MPYLHQYDYIFALGLIFAFLDSWNIGANDVANSFATSVSSRSLTMKQAMVIASLCEFGGAVLVGARVADTIRSKIIAVERFNDQPEILMLGMLCALVGSSTYLTIATRIGLPVSTTHCIVGGVIGVGIATIGADGVNWGWKGVSQVFAAWVVAPGIAGVLAAILFLITKHGIMKRANPLRNGLIAIPCYFALTSGVLTMMVVWKGGEAPFSLSFIPFVGLYLLGFSMELGAALTVVMATRLALPISTTQCIVGATVGVGLCTGDIKAINWRMVAWIYLGWFITLPCTGLIAGCLMGLIINAPRWGS